MWQTMLTPIQKEMAGNLGKLLGKFYDEVYHPMCENESAIKRIVRASETNPDIDSCGIRKNHVYIRKADSSFYDLELKLDPRNILVITRERNKPDFPFLRPVYWKDGKYYEERLRKSKRDKVVKVIPKTDKKGITDFIRTF